MGVLVNLTEHDKAASGRYTPFRYNHEAVDLLRKIQQEEGLELGEILDTVSFHETSASDVLDIIAVAYRKMCGSKLQLEHQGEVIDMAGIELPVPKGC